RSAQLLDGLVGAVQDHLGGIGPADETDMHLAWTEAVGAGSLLRQDAPDGETVVRLAPGSRDHARVARCERLMEAVVIDADLVLGHDVERRPEALGLIHDVDILDGEHAVIADRAILAVGCTHLPLLSDATPSRTSNTAASSISLFAYGRSYPASQSDRR